ncbi:MAG: class I SAM-dependent methyltransferase, partial [Candidatus Omnitrophica bacterium]|nr:class I SAM-dependent methyltransferase [Candidatus Omnitrophota bacterium]
PIERKDKSLTEISGFTNYCSDQAAFRQQVLENLMKEFKYSKSVNVCEVGCGCGDKLTHFYNLGHQCSGLDYSENMIKRAKEEMPKADLHPGEAAKLPFADNSMDFVFSYSVFIYFETPEYFHKVLEEMYRIAKPGATICIWDVPDLKDKEKVEAFRGKSAQGYEHTYYDMNDFFIWFKERKIKDIKCEYNIIPEYRLSNHRFNLTVNLNKDNS